MPTLLNAGQPLKGTSGTSTIFITLPTAQLSLGQTPTRDTGYTLVTGPNGQLGFTATLGGVLFKNNIVQANQPNSNLTIQSNGTGTVSLQGNVLINGKDITELTGTIHDLTVTNLTVTGQALFTSATSTATFAGDISAQAIYDTGNRVLTSFTVITSDGLQGGQVVSYNSSTIRLVNTGVLEALPGAGIELNTPTGVVTITNKGVLSIVPGDDISVNTTTGNVTVSNTSTLQTVTNRGSTTTNAIHITSVTSSTTSTDGALVVDGGVGIGGDVHVAGQVYSAWGQPLYTLRVLTTVTPPVDARIGDFWIDPAEGVEYQFVPSGTGGAWVQFIGF